MEAQEARRIKTGLAEPWRRARWKTNVRTTPVYWAEVFLSFFFGGLRLHLNYPGLLNEPRGSENEEQTTFTIMSWERSTDLRKHQRSSLQRSA